jgi:hypothetical protein
MVLRTFRAVYVGSWNICISATIDLPAGFPLAYGRAGKAEHLPHGFDLVGEGLLPAFFRVVGQPPVGWRSAGLAASGDEEEGLQVKEKKLVRFNYL